MISLNENQLGKVYKPEKQWKFIYNLGAITAIIMVIGSLLDILISIITQGGDLSALPQTAGERFTQLNSNPFLGLYNLDLLNMLTTLVMIPTTFALCTVHRKVNAAFSVFTMFLSTIGTTIFVVNNGALSMLALSNKYAAASTETQKVLFLSAGEAILARGEHGSPGVFLSFALPLFVALLISLIMLRGKIFSKVASYLGITGNLLMLLYVVLVTFVPKMKNFALVLASPGGLLLIAWLIMISIRLFQLGNGKREEGEN